MAVVIADLAKQSGCRIMVSDEPRDNRADIEFSGSVKDALEKVTCAYDYSWRLNKRGVVLMTKRFSRPDEYPVLNARELHQVAQDTSAVYSAFDFDFKKNWDAAGQISALYALLSPEQSVALRAGQRISVGQISPAQRQQAQTAVLSSLLGGSHSAWSGTTMLLDRVANATPASFLRVWRQEHKPSGNPTAPAVSDFFEMFEYVLVNKQGKTESVLLSGNGITPPAQTTGNAP